MNPYEYYKQAGRLAREALELSLEEDDDKNAKFVNEVFDEWASLMSDMKLIVLALKNSWRDEIKLKEQLKYLG